MSIKILWLRLICLPVLPGLSLHRIRRPKQQLEDSYYSAIWVYSSVSFRPRTKLWVHTDEAVVWYIRHEQKLPYHLAENGAVELFNQTLFNQTLLCLLWSLQASKQNHWPEYLSDPLLFVFGRHMVVDVELGVGPQLARQDIGCWVKDYQKRLAFTYRFAKQRAKVLWNFRLDFYSI